MVVVKFKRRIYEDLIELLEIAKSVKFSISYIKESGVQLILDYLSEDTELLTCTSNYKIILIREWIDEIIKKSYHLQTSL